MSDKHIEKSFLYLLAFSVVLHVVVFTIFLTIPQENKQAKQEPYMVELRDLPEVKKQAPSSPDKEVKRLDDKKRRVEREMAPKGERERDRIASIPPLRSRPLPPEQSVRPAVPRPSQQRQPTGMEREPRRPVEQGRYPARREAPAKEAPTAREGKPRKERLPELAKLMPSAQSMAKLEDIYRKKYGPEVEEGETKFLNTDDILFGSFLRRFEGAVYGVWRYPQDAARMGIEGTTPVRITFDRSGVIVNVEILETSGSRILDNEVVRTLRQIGPVGGFPKGYTKETFNLIAFFQYGLTSGSRRIH